MQRFGLMMLSGLFMIAAQLNALANEGSPERSYVIPEDVLSASAEHFPKVLESLAQQRAAEANVTAAKGAFDLVFEGGGFDRVGGFWDGRIIDATVKRNIRPLGGEIYGGYRVSRGRFPIYEDENFTNTGGELKIGALFSLLRNRSIDERRFREQDASLALAQADLELFLTRVGVQHKALAAYWRWVARGHQLAVYEDLLQLAEARETGLERQVQSGALAAIFLTENKQNILRRKRLVAEAERDFQTASNALSFYFRDSAGDLVVLTKRNLPPLSVLEPISSIGVDEHGDAFAALAARPELGIVQLALERADRRIAVSRNALQPQFDVRAEVSRDFGDIAEGGPSRDSTDAIVGLRFSTPFQRRGAKGELRRARAERDALVQRRRQTRDQIEVELRDILVELSMSHQLAVIADQEVEQANIMRKAEEKRFSAGASDFFLLNIREETAADARIRFYFAELAARLARADYDAATINGERLGLSAADAS